DEIKLKRQYPDTCKTAKAKGICIHTIQCGNSKICEFHFKKIASLAGCKFVKVQQTGGTVATPAWDNDKELADLHDELLKITIIYGDGKAQTAARARKEKAQKLPTSLKAERVAYIARRGVPSDLLHALKTGQLELRTLKVEQLPDELRTMS